MSYELWVMSFCCTFIIHHSIINRQLITHNRQPSTVNRQPSTINRQPSTKMILLIDTAQETATAALAEAGRVLFSEENINAKDAAAWLHPAIGRLMEQAGKTVRELEAVAVVAGPGSYTGLRVGMAAAKGLCYALKIPLITRNTLQVMAASMRPVAREKKALICPMIDARRDEVFTALYGTDMQEILLSHGP